MGKKFKDLKIGRKLLISYGAIIFLYIITVTASLLGIAKTSNTLDVFYQKAFAVSYTALDMKASVQGIGRCILDVATGVTAVSYTHLDVYKRQPFRYRIFGNSKRPLGLHRIRKACRA